MAIDDDALLICPWASRSPFELRIVPRNPAPSFERDGEVGLGMLRTALRALEARFETVPQFNAWTITAPRGAETVPLASRHRAADRDPRRLRDVDRRRAQRLPA